MTKAELKQEVERRFAEEQAKPFARIGVSPRKAKRHIRERIEREQLKR